MKTNKQSVQVILLNLVEASTYAKKIGFSKIVSLLLMKLIILQILYKRICVIKNKFNYLAKHLSNCVSNKNVKVIPLTATPIKEKYK